MKLTLIILLFTIVLSASALGKDLRGIPKKVKLDLSGAIGFDGVDGKNAPVLDCSNFEGPVDGIDGQDGSNGEVGEKGENLYVFVDDSNHLSRLTLYQNGGVGGEGGTGGVGSSGCNGGLPGRKGIKGFPGQVGDFGKFYLLPFDFEVPKTTSTKILSLSQLEGEEIVLSENTWFINDGLQAMLGSGSRVEDRYFTFNKTVSHRIRLVWNSNQFINDFEDTKFALSVKDGILDLKSYTGGFLEYSIKKTSVGFDVVVTKVIAEHTVQNLKLKRIKYSGIDLTLEVKQKFDPNVAVKTRFVIAIERIKDREILENTGFIEIPATLVSKSVDRYFLTIGRLRIPESFKKKGTKLKILLTVYREVQGQTRARGLEGIFKI